MKKTLIIATLFVLALCLVVFILVRATSPIGWRSEPRAVRILSVDPVSASDFYESGGSAGDNREENSTHYFYRAKAVDVASGVTLRWKLNCDQEINPPATMTYTPDTGATAPRLEIRAVVSGPYKDEQEATASLGGSVPADEELKDFFGVEEDGSSAKSVYVLQRTAIVAGNDFRSADPVTNSYTGRRMVDFTLTKEAGGRFYDYTSKNIGHGIAVVLNGQVREVATIQSAIRDRGEITGSFTQDEVAALSRLLRAGTWRASLNDSTENHGSLDGTGNSSSQKHCSVLPDFANGDPSWINR
jgi:hypothetical protein